MRVVSAESSGFRNLADQRIELGESITVVHGPNGAGKTNLLEAVYFGLTGSGCRPGPDRDLIGFERDASRVELEWRGEGERHTMLAALSRDGERRLRLDGRAPAPGDPRPLAAVFLPDRLQLVKGPPAHRRAHLDRFVGALWPARSELRRSFGATLGQRNALVARVRAGQASAASLTAWDERLAAEAEPLIASRREAVEQLAAPFARAAEELGLDHAALAYRPRAEGGAEQLAAELSERRRRGLDRAYTSYGPQLDEIRLMAGARQLRRFGSQGQQRVALLGLLFAERQVLIAAGRPPPIMLLDDVMSELDPDRRQRLIAALADHGQSLISATERSQVPASEAHAISIKRGRATAPTAIAEAA
jgi:DNA replication and repair protein RecF